MKLRNCFLLAVAASLALAVPALATTYDLNNDFSSTSATGVWNYGWTGITNGGWGMSPGFNPSTYAFNADTASHATFHDGVAGSMWGEGTTGGQDEVCDWIGQATAAPGWVFGPWGAGVFVGPQACGPDGASGNPGWGNVIRFTPGAGTFNYTGDLTNIHEGSLIDLIIKVGADGSRSILHDMRTTPLAPADSTNEVYAVDTFGGTVTLGAGDSLDLVIYQAPVYYRSYGKVNLTITGDAQTPEPGSVMALMAGLMSLGGLALSRRK